MRDKLSSRFAPSSISPLPYSVALSCPVSTIGFYASSSREAFEIFDARAGVENDDALIFTDHATVQQLA